MPVSKFSKKTQGQVEFLILKGFTNQEISKALGIARKTLWNWRKAHPEFFEAVKVAKEAADRKVERSLWERANGYSHPEDKIFNNNGKPLVVPTIKHYPPDTTAAIFWLKNRQRERWKDTYKQEVEGEVTVTVIDRFGNNDST